MGVIIGNLMIASFFIGMFIFMAIEAGFKAACGIFLTAAGISAFIYVGCYLSKGGQFDAINLQLILA